MLKSVKGLVFIFFILFLHNFVYSQNYWIRQASPTSRLLTKCIFVDSLYGWAAGDSGTVLYTTNGQSWVVQNSGITSSQIDDIFFLNRRLGWGLSNDYSNFGTFVLKTTDGGQTWTNSRYPDSTLYLLTVFFIDSATGFLGDVGGHILKTTNAGLSWNNCTINAGTCYNFPVRKINFLNSQTGFACGGQMDITGEVWKTTNAGLNWDHFCICPEPMYDIKFAGGKIMISGGDYEYGAMTIQSSNEGNSWNVSFDSCFGIGKSLAFRTPAEVWIPLGYSRSWIVSTDSGNGGSWHCLNAPDTSAVYSAWFTSPVNGWAFGSEGAIYKYNPGIIGIANNTNNVPFTIKLFQNYPNPFNPSTSIKFYLAKTGKIKLAVFDLLGREVKVLINGVSEAGEKSIMFEADDLPSGIYFYRLEAGSYKESKKMVLIK
jgi:photosystem II stability/assembly factor-like uncharacterized protein